MSEQEQSQSAHTYLVQRGVAPLSWHATAHELLDAAAPGEEQATLQWLLQGCLGLDGWADNPLEEQLFPFLALCWQYLPLRDMLHRQLAIERWTAERRRDFLLCIEQAAAPAVPPLPAGPGPALAPPIQGLQRTSTGKIQESMYNYLYTLRNDPAWQGRLRFDTFRHHTMLDGQSLTDADETLIGYWFAEHHNIGANMRVQRRDAIHAAAAEHPYDPLREYVEGLPAWDGHPRLTDWLMRYCGAQALPLIAWIGRVFIVQMIARACEPGCQARYVLILEGDENTGKSKCVRILGGDWAGTIDIGLDTKEAYMLIRGVWVAEFPELHTLSKTRESKMKSFLTQEHDAFIPKFSNNKMVYHRRTVFVGTTNDEEYLGGESGNTRYLPVKTGVTSWDLEALARDREQLLAEARTAYEATRDSWWLPPEGLDAYLRTEREARRYGNIYEEPLEAWLDGEQGAGERPPLYRDTVSWPEIAEEFLQLKSRGDWKDKNLQMQIMQALRSLGWIKQRTSRRKFWQRPESENG